MNQASAWRLQLAPKVAPVYADHPKVAAVLVGGSVSRGVADRYSDVEIGVYWTEPPSAEERRALGAPAWGVRGAGDWAAAAPAQRKAIECLVQAYMGSFPVKAVVLSGGASHRRLDRYADIELTLIWEGPPRGRREAIRAMGPRVRLLSPVADDSGQDRLVVEGCTVAARHVEEVVFKSALTDVIQRHDPDPAKQRAVAALMQGVALVGETLVEKWRQQAALYPVGLSVAVVQARLDDFMWQYSNRIDVYAWRQALPWFYWLFCYQAEQMLQILLGLNRLYAPGCGNYLPFYTDPLQPLMARLQVAPADFAGRFGRLFGARAAASRWRVAPAYRRDVRPCRSSPAGHRRRASAAAVLYRTPQGLGRAAGVLTRVTSCAIFIFRPYRTPMATVC